MVLNYIWIAFFLIAFAVALVRLVFLGDTQVFPEIINSTFSSSKTAFEISLGLTGVLSLWLGIMKIGEKGGVIALFSKLLSPLFCKLFPEIPKGHPVTGSIFMNLAANMLGLDNAATPLGLKAMEGLQELNPKKDTATNPMIMFLVLNTSGLTLIPISIMVYRAQLGAAQPTDIFVPILLATFFSTLAGIITVSIYQKINLLNRTILLFLGGISLLVAGIIYFFNTLSRTQIDIYSTTTANVFLFLIIIGFIIAGMKKKINVYDAFVEGAKEGLVVIDMSSIAPLVSREIYEALKEKGVKMIDAPVSGGEPKAIDGTMSVMVGGDKEVFDACYDVMDAMAGSVVYTGEIGAGNITKLANQTIVALNIAAMSEAYILATKAGVDPELVYQAIRGGLAGSTVLDAKSNMVMDRNFKPGFRIDLHIKDLGNVLDTAHGVGAPLPLTAAVMEMMQAIKLDGCGTEDHSSLVKYYEKLANAQVVRKGN